MNLSFLDFNKQNTWKQALYFYMGYVGCSVLIGGGVNEIAKHFGLHVSHREFLLVLPIFLNSALVMALTYLTLFRRKLHKDPAHSALILLSVVISLVFGVFIGLFVPTAITLKAVPGETNKVD